MNKTLLAKYRDRLREDGRRVQATAGGLEDEARASVGGEAAGGLSNTPMHLGDLGSEAYAQELNATLLENEKQIAVEIRGALKRIDDGTFGVCENCGAEIAEERLEILPYAAYCAACAAQLQDGQPVNLNHGRPQIGRGTLNPHDDGPEERRAPPGKRRKAKRNADTDADDRHAVGTPGGGTACGGLGGTNVGAGDPDDVDLESAMGSGTHDGEEDDAAESEEGQAGGGTPTGKRTPRK